MSDIHYVRRHALPLAQAKKIAQKTADDLAAEYNLVSEWDGDTLHFHRSGVEGSMEVTTQQIRLDVKLGFLLRAFKGAFERHIEQHLDKLLAEAAPAKKSSRKA